MGVRRLLRLALKLGLVAALLVAIANVVVLRGGRGQVDKVVDAPHAQVALVLGAGLNKDGAPSAMLRDRIIAGADLYKAHKVDRVIVSGDHGSVGYDEVDTMLRGLVAQGVPARVVFTDHAGFDTLDSVIRARKVFGVRSALIVSQHFHLARAVWLARRQGIRATGFAADHGGYGKQGKISQVRELIARVKAVKDVVTGAGPQFLGPKIDLSGDASASRSGR